MIKKNDEDNDTVDDFIENMLVDKKATDLGLRFIVFNEIGNVELVEGVSEEILFKTLAAGKSLLESG